MPTIDHLSYPSPNHEARSDGISAIVIHHGAGTRKSDLATLTSPATRVSAHYYVCRDGTIYQLVPDPRAAWHAGKSAIDGVPNVNDYSLGIETEHQTLPKLPQHTDWPQLQLDSLAWLIRTKAAAYQIPPARVVSHRAIAIPKGRKADPRDAPLAPEPAFRAWVARVFAAPPAPTRYTELSPLMGAPTASLETVALRFPIHAVSAYSDLFIQTTILPGYWELAQMVGLDPLVAIAQLGHETGYLTAFWSQPPHHNPAGIGVTGQHQAEPPNPQTGWAYNTQRQRWEVGLTFPDWQRAIRAHVGRLVAYATQPPSRTLAQATLVREALAWRPLPPKVHGSAQVLKHLGKAHNPSGQGWASPGTEYGAKLAGVANRLAGAP